jgi:hypothetical protein
MFANAEDSPILYGCPTPSQIPLRKDTLIDYTTVEEFNCYQLCCLKFGVSFADALILVWGPDVYKLSGLSSRSRKLAEDAVNLDLKRRDCLEKYDVIGAKIFKLLSELSFEMFRMIVVKDVAECSV